MKVATATVLVTVLLASAFAQGGDRRDHQRAALVPKGRLRVALNLANPNLVTPSVASSERRGVAVDLASELARQLGVPFDAIEYPSAGAIVADAARDRWDIAFLAVDPGRASAVELSAPYMEVDNTYLVSGTKFQSVEDVDSPGTRIAVPRSSAPDLYLSRVLTRGELVRITGNEAEAVRLLSSGAVQAVAADREWLLRLVLRAPGTRVLDGRFTAVLHAIAVPKGNAASIAVVQEFVAGAMASGLVKAAIARAGLRGVRAATARRPGTGEPRV